jgi:hypothetical protein
VNAQNRLGIYISKDKATVVYLGQQTPESASLDCFSVCMADEEEQTMNALANRIAQGCAERQWQYSEAAVALDCALFMQHKVHSDFSEPKRVRATVRFDTEEAVATDITDLAIAFQITSSNERGSELAVFSADRKLLSDVLASLQSYSIDPVTIEPDVNALARFIGQTVPPSEAQDAKTLFGVLSDQRGYFVTSSREKTMPVRTFLISPNQNRDALLSREAITTSALSETDEPVRCLRVFDSTHALQVNLIRKRFGREVETIDLADAAKIDPEAFADGANTVDLAIAYGAALTASERTQVVDFRSDFMPYQGKKRRMQETMKVVSIAATVLLLAAGLYTQTKLFQRNKYLKRLDRKLSTQYAAVMSGKKPDPGSNPARKLASELRRVRELKSGQSSITGEKSIVSKLTLVLEAFNKCASQTDLNIDSVTLTDRSIRIRGDTSSRSNTLQFFDAIRSTRLQILSPQYTLKGGRDTFTITVVPQSS